MYLGNKLLLKNVISLFRILQYHSNVIIHLISNWLIEKVFIRDHSFLIYTYGRVTKSFTNNWAWEIIFDLLIMYSYKLVRYVFSKHSKFHHTWLLIMVEKDQLMLFENLTEKNLMWFWRVKTRTKFGLRGHWGCFETIHTSLVRIQRWFKWPYVPIGLFTDLCNASWGYQFSLFFNSISINNFI